MALQIPGLVHVAAWTVLGVGVGVVLAKQKDISDRLDKTEAAREAAVDTPDSSRGEAKALAERLAALEQKDSVRANEQKRASDEVRKVAGDLTKVWGELLKGTGAPAGKGGEFESEVRGVLDKYVMEKQFREKLGKAGGIQIPKKPDYPVLAKALNLRPEQSDRFAQDIHGIQQELFSVLSTPRSDGVVLMDEIQQAEQYPEGSPQRTAPFLKLFKLKIPDTDETYVERAITLASGVKTRAQEYFDKDQVEILNGVDLDWFGIKFPN